MKYEKPEITLMNSALDAIQSCQSKIILVADCSNHGTNAAYEADE
jgi:hypothetical protein